MDKNAVHELIPFNTDEKKRGFYIDVLYRQIKPMPYSGIFHYHKNIELIYCVSGKLKISFINNEIALKEGDFLFVNSSVPHSTDPIDAENVHYCIKFNPVVVTPKASRPIPNAEHFFSILPEYILFPNGDDSDYIYRLCKRCRDYFTHDKLSKRLVLQASVMELSSYVLENGVEDISELDFSNQKTIYFDTIAYINQNYASATLKGAAENASMSYSYFSRLFKTEFNTSFSKYLTSVRIQKSMELLSNTSMSISDISVACGFSNLSHYTKCFKEEKGITPHRFRSIIENRDI